MEPVVHSGVYTMQDRMDLIAGRVDASITRPQTRTDGQQYMLRDLALEIVRGVPQHGSAAEDGQIAAVFSWVKANIEYRQDPDGYDEYRSAGRTINAGAGDCFTLDTKVIVRSQVTGCYELRTLADLETTWPAYDALSYDFENSRWAFQPIQAWHDKGICDVWESHLSNGPSFRYTPDHEVWWYDGSGPDPKRRVVRAPFEARLDETRSYFKRVLVAQQIPALNAVDLSQAEAYLTGIYAAEGYYAAHKLQIAQDKKEIVAKIEKSLTDSRTPFRYYDRGGHNAFCVHSSKTKEWLQRQGTNSFDMTFNRNTFGGSEEAIRTALEAHGDGDAYRPKPESVWASKVSAIHATSSPDLAAELQLMSMILGEAWHTQLQLNHGGAGKSPIYRFHRWLPETQPSRRKVAELPGVGFSNLRSIAPAGRERVCCLTVKDTHNFILSNGMICKNCDDHLILNTGLLTGLGFKTGARICSPDKAGWHIYSIVGARPFHAPTLIYPFDTTQDGSFVGWEPPAAMRRYLLQCDFRGGKAVGLRSIA